MLTHLPSTASNSIRHSSRNRDQALLEPFKAQMEIEDLAQRADKLSAYSAERIDGELEVIEGELEAHAARDPELSNEIRIMRAELCSKIGFGRHERRDCDLVMRQSCSLPILARKGSKEKTNEDAEVGVLLQTPEMPIMPMLICQRYFRKETPSGMATSDINGAPSPAAMSSPSPSTFAAPAPAPAVAEELQGLPEQGFGGESVAHADAKTQTSDWREEFGPRSGQRSIKEICSGLERNSWCRMHLRYIKGGTSARWQVTWASALVAIAVFFVFAEPA